MKRAMSIVCLVAASMAAPAASAYDACATGAIHTKADVTVSDGMTYSVESFYRSRKRAAAHFSSDGGAMYAVEGGLAWSRSTEGEALAGAFVRDFALGHNFHAFLLRFEDVVEAVERVDGIEFDGRTVTGQRGVRESGDPVYLIDGASPAQPAGMRYDVGDMKIEITVSDWREENGGWVPYELVVDDGQRDFTYRFSFVDLAEKPLLWFDETVAEPAVDHVQIYRLHRRQLAAHCLADAALLAAGTAPEAMMVNRGSIDMTTPEEVEARFKAVFERVRYDRYVDLRDPAIEVSTSGEIGWSIVNLSVAGHSPLTDERFEDQWAWVSLVRKVDGRWLMAGNASNRRSN